VQRHVQYRLHHELHLHGELRMRSPLAALALTAVVLSIAGPARAQDRPRARAAYDRGTEAFGRGDFAAAAAAYAEADSAAPSDVALQAALDAAVRADDPLLGAELLERAKSRTPMGSLASSVSAAQTKLGHRAGRIRLSCPSSCAAMVDSRQSLAPGASMWLAPGVHTVAITTNAGAATQDVNVSADSTVDVEPPSPPAAAPVAPPPAPDTAHTAPAPRKGRGLPSGIFWGGLGATALLGAATGVLWSVAKSKHDDFLAANCDVHGSPACRSQANDGLPYMVTGDALFGIGCGVAVFTAIAGVWFVNWEGSAKVTAVVVPHGGVLGWQGRF
jgi:hypothetical protein